MLLRAVPLQSVGGSVLAAGLLLAVAACGSGDEMGAPAAGDTAAAERAEKPTDELEYPYEVYTRGMFADTLRGSAGFGTVFDPIRRRRQWIVSMSSGADVTSGVYIARPDTSLPSSGTYQIVKRRPVGRADSVRAAGTNTFTMIYRAGMRRSFHSQSGTLELTTVTDSLVEGTFEATLDGSAALPGQPPQQGTLTVRGTFRAEKEMVGFMFGV